MTTRRATARGKACPICGKPASAADKPFCSSRCADVDLNRWLGGVYRIPTDEAPADMATDDQARLASRRSDFNTD